MRWFAGLSTPDQCPMTQAQGCRLSSLFLALAALPAEADSTPAQTSARVAGYLYLSPVPGASYVSRGTTYVLVRFEHVRPAEVENLTTSFITVTGASSGAHPGITKVARLRPGACPELARCQGQGGKLAHLSAKRE